VPESIDQINLKYSERSALIEEFGDIGFFKEEEAILKRFLTPPPLTILDLGCGYGRTTIPLKKMGYDVIGLDVSGHMLRHRKWKGSDVSLIQASGPFLPFPDGLFDFILFSFHGIDYIFPEKMRSQCVREIRRVLRQDGLFVYNSQNDCFILPRPTLKPRNILSALTRWVHWRKLTGHYWITKGVSWPLILYAAPPSAQVVDLWKAGFRTIEVVGNQFLNYSIYYICERSDTCARRVRNGEKRI